MWQFRMRAGALLARKKGAAQRCRAVVNRTGSSALTGLDMARRVAARSEDDQYWRRPTSGGRFAR